jgi:hypothetical protein
MCGTEQGQSFHFVVVLRRSVVVSFRLSESLDLLWIAKELRVDAKDERGIDRLARAADLGCIFV